MRLSCWSDNGWWAYKNHISFSVSFHCKPNSSGLRRHERMCSLSKPVRINCFIICKAPWLKASQTGHEDRGACLGQWKESMWPLNLSNVCTAEYLPLFRAYHNGVRYWLSNIFMSIPASRRSAMHSVWPDNKKKIINDWFEERMNSQNTKKEKTA